MPHPKHSGRCYTYDPPWDSSVGWWFGIRLKKRIKLLYTTNKYLTNFFQIWH